MGVHAERDYKAEEHSRRTTRAAVQLGGLHDALTIYNMCTQKPPHDYSQQLYDKYRESFQEYITSYDTSSESEDFPNC
ncbi:hypothetical protein ACSBR2_010879 [Camellia fascicularis]